jgi:regulatory protein
MNLKNKPEKILTPLTALQKARAFCAYQERSHQEVRDKLYSWKLHAKEVENIIAALISEDFLNEERFAKAFASGKFRIKGWGRIKIIHELRQRNISEYCIKAGLRVIGEEEYLAMITGLIRKHLKKVNEPDALIKKSKVAHSLINKGFEPSLVWKALNIDPL